jgi:hypothetical protein
MAHDQHRGDQGEQDRGKDGGTTMRHGNSAIGRLSRLNLRNRRDEAIAARRDRLDEVLTIDAVAERVAQCRDGVGEVRLLHEGVGPDRGEQFLLGDQPSATVDEIGQQIECLGRERDRLVVSQQQSLGRIQPKGTKGVD